MPGYLLPEILRKMRIHNHLSLVNPVPEIRTRQMLLSAIAVHCGNVSKAQVDLTSPGPGFFSWPTLALAIDGRSDQRCSRQTGYETPGRIPEKVKNRVS